MIRLLLITLIVIFSNTIQADSFRCGKSLVKVGDSPNMLIKKCGDPARKYSSKESIHDNGREFRAGVSNWVYVRRGGKDMIVSIYNGTIVKMQVD
jgi:hypothetical protein